MAFSTATLTGTYQHFDGSPAQGVVEIIPNGPVLIDGEGNVTLSGAAFALTGGAGCAVTIRGALVTNGTFNLLSRTGTQAQRVVGATLPADVSLLTPTDGDLAHNTNAALGCGVGPAVYNSAAAKWKGLYSGVTN